MSNFSKNGILNRKSPNSSSGDRLAYISQIAEQRYFRRLLQLLLIGLAIASIYLLAYRPGSVSLTKAVLALGITWLGFMPGIAYLREQPRPPIPFFPLIGLFYATNYGLPMFASDLQSTSQFRIENVTPEALTLVLAGMAGMNFAFFASKYFLWQQASSIRLPGPFPLGRMLTLLWLLLLAHLAFRYVPLLATIPSVGQFLEPVGYLTYGMFYVIWARGKLSAIQTFLILGVCIPLEVVPRLTTGLLSQVMLLVFFMILVVWYEFKRIPVSLISVLLIFLIFFNPVKTQYRDLVWSGAYSQANLFDKSILFVELAWDRLLNGSDVNRNENFIDSAIKPFISRTAYITVFSSVVEDTPKIVPYWNGETYLPLLTSYIPRFLWADKPNQLIGNEFGRRYGYLEKDDFFTSFNLPWIIEMYANYGYRGVLIGMPLVGLLLAFLDKKFNSPGMNSLEVMFGATILFGLIYQESNFSLMVGAILNLSLSLFIVFKILIINQKNSIF